MYAPCPLLAKTGVNKTLAIYAPTFHAVAKNPDSLPAGGQWTEDI